MDTSFIEKVKTSNNTIVTENNKLGKEDGKYMKPFNTYFVNITKGLNLQMAEKDQSFENEESYRLIKYLMEMKHFRYNLYLNKAFLKL